MNITSKLLLAATFLSSSAYASEWELDASHTTTSFAVRHMMVSTTKGAFDKVTGTANIDDKDFAKSQFSVIIDVNSINTRNAQRDGHLRSAEFFDVAKFPNLTFKSTKIVATGGGKFDVTGDLTLHGVTKPVTLSVDSVTPATKTPFGTTVRGLQATGKINRKEFGLTWNKALEAGGVAVSEDVKLEIDAEFTQKVVAVAAPAAPAAVKK